MKGKVIILLGLFLLAVIQSSALPVFFESRAIPNLFLILVVFFSSRRGTERGLWLALSSGLILDMVSFWPIGANMLTLSLAAYISSSISKRFLTHEETSSYFLIAGVLVGAILSQEITLFIIFKIREGFLSGEIIQPAPWQLIREITEKTIWSLILLIFLYPVMRKIDRFFFGPARNIYLSRQ